jgi:hypothetical protein
MKDQQVINTIALQKPLVSDQLAQKRVERAEGQLKAHKSPDDWKKVLFSNKCYFGFSNKGRVYIKQRIRTRNDPEHIQYPWEPCNKDRKQVYT